MLNRCRRCILILSVIFFLILLLFDHHNYFALRLIDRYYFGYLSNNTNSSYQPIILTWTKFFGMNLSSIAESSMQKCTLKCIYTDDRRRFNNASAIIFHPRDINRLDLPKKKRRQMHQKYVFFLAESPHHSGNSYQLLPKYYFNLTMTYRLDSDIWLYYDRFERREMTDSIDEYYSWDTVVDRIRHKSSMIVQLVSHCHTPSAREYYVAELNKYIPVDIIGLCAKNGTKQCNKRNECDRHIVDNYRYYLAFENSVCRDYVTEKFWRLKQLIVPIVLRRSDYLHLAPNHSYIAVDDFRSPMQLANYLKTTSDNETQYLKYFEWTRIYRRKNRSNNPYCQLCEHLHNRTVVTKSYDMNQWWKVDGNCQMGYAHQFLNN